MPVAISAESLSKKYLISHQKKERYTALRDVVAGSARAIGRKLLRPFSGIDSATEDDATTEEFWALKDLNFEIREGDRVGIIGRNGAGKSTLLKLLSRITEPTTGRIELHGRVVSLLEVGTGFHPELTGRENIFLNGAILGMGKEEIRRRFDEIVAFAEIERFLDTPVKRYSSGMYVRLAFAVAAHLNAEILLVDEVLAVGDARFQERCLTKMEEVGEGGRTVLFVSHSMPSILRLTPRTILLSEGKILADGASTQITQRYLGSEYLCPPSRTWGEVQTAPGDEVSRLLSISVKDASGQVKADLEITEPIFLELEYFNLQPESRVTGIVHLYNEAGTCLFASNDWNDKVWWHSPRRRGVICSVCKIPANYLAEGRFFVLAALASYNPDVLHCIERDAISFQVIDRSTGEGARGYYGRSDWPGVVRPLLEWSVRYVPHKLADV